MERVVCSRDTDRSPAAVRDDLQDVVRLTEAAGFDTVERDGDTVHVENRVGLARVEMTFRLRPSSDADLAYEQVEGLFDEMVTRYEVTATEDGTRVDVETEFELGVSLLGDVLDATVIRRQRRDELTDQLDWLASGGA